MSTQPGETIIYHGHPSWRSMLDLHLAGLVLAALGGVIARLVSTWGLAAGIFAAILVISLVVGFTRRAATEYTISDRRLYIRRGLFSRTEQHTTIDRVQNVEVRQSVLERMLAIGTIDFDTAATDESAFAFKGIAAPRRVAAAVNQAEDLRPRMDAGPDELPAGEAEPGELEPGAEPDDS
jgi:uncharacterized membrane protein YdbT with pleckstrin-like domain